VLKHGSFQDTLSEANARDFVYLDPPYDVPPQSKSFTQYAERFGAAEQDALLGIYQELDARGCRLMMSNSDTLANRARYREYRLVEVRAPRLISRNGAGRTAVTELAILNY
jgi:DNA adenine methylase